MINPKSKSTVDQLLSLAAQTEIVKHVPGRIQLKLKLTGISLALNLDLLGLKASIQGILGANVSGTSVVIDYDEKVLPKELWELMIKSNGNPKIQQLVRRELQARLGTS